MGRDGQKTELGGDQRDLRDHRDRRENPLGSHIFKEVVE